MVCRRYLENFNGGRADEVVYPEWSRTEKVRVFPCNGEGSGRSVRGEFLVSTYRCSGLRDQRSMYGSKIRF